MGRAGFLRFTVGLLFGLPVLALAAARLLGGSLDPATCADAMGCLGMGMAGFVAAPLVIVVAGVGMGIVVLLRARTASLSALWGFLAMILTVQAMALVASLALQGGFLAAAAVADPIEMALRSAVLWLLGTFVLFLVLVPEWRGPAFLDIGLSLVAAAAAIIVIAVGHSVAAVLVGYFLELQQGVANAVAHVPNVDWIALGVFVTALAGIIAGRVLPEAV